MLLLPSEFYPNQSGNGRDPYYKTFFSSPQKSYQFEADSRYHYHMILYTGVINIQYPLLCRLPSYLESFCAGAAPFPLTLRPFVPAALFSVFSRPVSRAAKACLRTASASRFCLPPVLVRGQGVSAHGRCFKILSATCSVHNKNFAEIFFSKESPEIFLK
jgi:hypothetical protein